MTIIEAFEAEARTLLNELLLQASDGSISYESFINRSDMDGSPFMPIEHLTAALRTAIEATGREVIGSDTEHSSRCAASIASHNDPDNDPPDAFESQCDCGTVEINARLATQRHTLERIIKQEK